MKGVPLEGFLEHKTQGYHENIFFSNKNSIYDRNHKVSKVHFWYENIYFWMKNYYAKFLNPLSDFNLVYFGVSSQVKYIYSNLCQFLIPFL